MSPSDTLELAIIAFIIIGIGMAIWRGGAKNPVATGTLNTKLTEINTEVAAVKTKVAAVEKRLTKVEGVAATAADIQRLEGQIADFMRVLPDIEARQRALSDKMAEHAKQATATATTVQHIDRQLDRIYAVVVPKGMEK